MQACSVNISAYILRARALLGQTAGGVEGESLGVGAAGGGLLLLALAMGAVCLLVSHDCE